MELSWDDYLSHRPNPFVTDLTTYGLSLLPYYNGWQGFQPISGEFLYQRQNPLPANVNFNGYWVNCFAANLEALLWFSAFHKVPKSDGPSLVSTSSLMAALDLCAAGLEAVANNASLPSGLTKVNHSRQLYYLLPGQKNTYVMEIPGGRDWHLYLAEQVVTPQELVTWLKNDTLTFARDFNKDPLGHHRARLGNVNFWDVLRIDHPAPAFGGTMGGKLPVEFIYGVISYIIRYPLWWKRMGSFPNP